jgi:hypothetical protein
MKCVKTPVPGRIQHSLCLIKLHPSRCLREKAGIGAMALSQPTADEFFEISRPAIVAYQWSDALMRYTREQTLQF